MTLASEEAIVAHGEQLGTLAPPGRAFSQEPGSVQAQLFEGMGFEFANLEARVSDLLREFDPLRTLELLGEWEEALGLPDPCVGMPATLLERRAALVARLVSLIGASSSDLVELGARLGYSLRVIEHRPFLAGRGRSGDSLTNIQKAFRAGIARAGDRISNLESWLYTVDVVAPVATVVRFSAGAGIAGEPLASWNNALLECTLYRVAPAHVFLRFLYELRFQLEQGVDASAGAIAPDIAFI